MIKKKIKKITNRFIGAGAFGLVSVFGFLIVNGILSLFPKIAGITSIIIGIAGLIIFSYLGYIQFKR